MRNRSDDRDARFWFFTITKIYGSWHVRFNLGWGSEYVGDYPTWREAFQSTLHAIRLEGFYRLSEPRYNSSRRFQPQPLPYYRHIHQGAFRGTMNKPKYFIEMTPGCPGFPPREHTELMDDKPLYQLSRHAPIPLPPDLDGQLRETFAPMTPVFPPEIVTNRTAKPRHLTAADAAKAFDHITQDRELGLMLNPLTPFGRHMQYLLRSHMTKP